MGLSKRLYEAKLEEESKYIKSDKFVCSNCINEKFVAQIIKDRGKRRECDFCGDNKKCIPLNDVLDLIYTYLYDEYSLAVETLPYAEGEYQGSTIDCYDILDADLDFMSPDVLSEIHECFRVQDQPFCDRGFIDPESTSEYLKYTWNYFIRVLQNKSRFTLLVGDDHDCGDLTPIGFCNTIGHYLSSMDAIKELQVSTKIFRARKTGGYELNAKQLGAPESKDASINRMSPAGISFFMEVLIVIHA